MEYAYRRLFSKMFKTKRRLLAPSDSRSQAIVATPRKFRAGRDLSVWVGNYERGGASSPFSFVTWIKGKRVPARFEQDVKKFPRKH